MPTTNTFNNDAGAITEQSVSGSMQSNAIKAMKDTVNKLMQQRYKNDPAKATKAANDFLNKFQKNAMKLQDMEIKNTATQLKDRMENANAIAKIQLAAATNAGDKIKGAGKAMATHLVASIASAFEGVGKLIDSYASTYSNYAATINARLQNFDDQGGKAFKDLSALVTKNLAASPYLKQEEMLKSLNTLVEGGISYNLEQRAFLHSMTDKIVNTFNVLDKTLLSMIRLQQQDTTQARMGMEAYLTKYLNSTYQDTSYLDDVYDTVTQNLFEASSQLGRNASIELEYVVQKWLGSMYSVGVGSEFLQTVAQGLGYLGSGDINALQSNEALQNLLVMASNRSGVEYAQILTQGLNADTANKLLQGITSYIHEMSNTSGNQIVRAQYADIFGMSLSDMTAMLNITTEEIGNIKNNMLSYNDTIRELESQLASVGSRMHISELYDNVIDNFMTGIAANIASNAGQYVTWKVVDFIEDATGGIAIPAVSIMGNMVDLNTTVTGLIKTGMVGVSTLGQIGSILTGLGNGTGLNLAAWGGSESTARGSGFGMITSGYSSTTSSSSFIGSSSGSDIYSSSVTAAKDKAKEENKGSEQNQKNDVELILEILDYWKNNDVNVRVTNYGLVSNNPATTSGF